jgi:glycosyltransferase involved in cell wall biosynthesis
MKKLMYIIGILLVIAKDNNSVKIEAGNLQKLNAAILDLYQNSIKREQIGKMARQFTEENFDIRKVAQKYAEIYEKL